MGFGANSLRYRKITLQKISSAHKLFLKYGYSEEERTKYINIMYEVYDKYAIDCDFDSIVKLEAMSEFYRDLEKILVDNFRSWVYDVLSDDVMPLEMAYAMIERHPFAEDTLVTQMEIIVDNWVLVHRGPVKELSEISGNRQSIHEDVVEGATEKGVSILTAFPVPTGQKTLSEIGGAFKKIADESKVVTVIADINDWGSRKAVIKKESNLYRNVLKGLWAKIKSYDDEGIRGELIKRLWEECAESVGMCADGHVGRLVNVLSGFDDDFSTQISKMEYFQNNIALIAANDLAPQEAKIRHAVKLMNDVGMPEEEREAWLQAL